MKVKKLALIAIAIVFACVSGCDEAAMVDDITADHSAEEMGTLAELKQAGAGTAAVPANPNPNHEEICKQWQIFPMKTLLRNIWRNETK